MTEIATDLLIIYIYSFATGAGLYYLCVPDFLKQRYLFPLLVPGLGLMQLAIVDAYLVYAQTDIRYSLYINAAMGIFAALVALLLRRNVALEIGVARSVEWVRNLETTKIVAAGAFLVLLAVVLTPVIRAGMATTPYRVGIDQVGYAETAQYLIEGGTLTKAQSILLKQLDTNDIRKAKVHNLKDLRFETYVDSEFLLKALRWGFPGVAASLTILTRSEHVFRIEFLLLIFSYALLLGLAYNALRSALGIPVVPALAIMAALALNCNLLNVYYEGQLAQVFMLPYFLMMLLIFLQAKALPQRLTGDILKTPAVVKGVLLFAMLVACMFSVYNEAMTLAGAFIILVLVLDVYISRKVSWWAVVLPAAGFLVGCLIAFPISSKWFPYTIANLRGLSRAGFWQPHWGSLAEILGLSDMYKQPGYSFIARSWTNEIWVYVLSALAFALIAHMVFRRRNIDLSFWLASFVIVAIAYVKMRFMDGILNYPYMKIYTMLTPLMVCAVFASLWAFSEVLPRRVRFLQYTAVVTVVITGALYISQYAGQSAFVTNDMFQLYRFNGERRFDQVALSTPTIGIGDFMLVPLLSMYWINEDGGEKYIAPYVNRPLVVALRTSDLHCPECVLRNYRRGIVYQNPSYIFLNSGLTLKGICVREANKYVVSALGYDPLKANWAGLPREQCDYQYAAKFLEKLNT